MERHLDVFVEDTPLALNRRLEAVTTTVYRGTWRTGIFAVLAGKAVGRAFRLLPVVGTFLGF